MTHWDFLLKEAHWMAKDFGQVGGTGCVLSGLVGGWRAVGVIALQGQHQ